MQLFQTTLGAARRDGDELVVLDGTAHVLEWAMSDDVAGAPGKQRIALSDAVLLAPTVPAQIVIVRQPTPTCTHICIHTQIIGG